MVLDQPIKKKIHATTLDELLDFNEQCFTRFKERPLFVAIKEGLFEKDEKKRLICFDYLQIFTDGFQKMLYARQASCSDEKFAPVFLEHLKEEIGHNDLFRDRDKVTKKYDPVLDAVCTWFIYQMLTLDNVEKTVVMHLVIESTGDYYHKVASNLSKFLHSDYYSVHNEHDEQHVAMGINLLRGYPPFVYDRIKQLIDQSWLQMITMVDRVYFLINQEINNS